MSLARKLRRQALAQTSTRRHKPETHSKSGDAFSPAVRKGLKPGRAPQARDHGLMARRKTNAKTSGRR